jgi:hypothetical protein
MQAIDINTQAIEVIVNQAFVVARHATESWPRGGHRDRLWLCAADFVLKPQGMPRSLFSTSCPGLHLRSRDDTPCFASTGSAMSHPCFLSNSTNAWEQMIIPVGFPRR